MEGWNHAFECALDRERAVNKLRKNAFLKDRGAKGGNTHGGSFILFMAACAMIAALGWDLAFMVDG